MWAHQSLRSAPLPSYRMRFSSFLFCSLICFVTLNFFFFFSLFLRLCAVCCCCLFFYYFIVTFWCHLPLYYLHNIFLCPSQTLYITVWLNQWVYLIHDCYFNWHQSMYYFIFVTLSWIALWSFRLELTNRHTERGRNRLFQDTQYISHLSWLISDWYLL